MGTELYAIELLRCWRYKRIIAMALICILMDCVVLAILVLMQFGLDVAFAAGSYAASIEAVAIAVLAMISGFAGSTY